VAISSIRRTPSLIASFKDAGGLASEAVEFESVATATQFALREHLPEAEIALRCDCLDREIGMPVLREWCDLEERQRLKEAA
jgi:hypothetical protein